MFTGAIAIVLAGGHAKRMGRDKLELRHEGIPLWRRVATEASRSCAQVVIVGPTRPGADGEGHDPAHTDARFHWTREDPAGAGPVAALAAGVAAARELRDQPIDHVVVLAGDAPFASRAIDALLEALVAHTSDAAVLTDADGRPQPLCAAYAARPLASALAAMGDLTGRSMRELLDHLDVVDVVDMWDASMDVDTPEDAQRLGYT